MKTITFRPIRKIKSSGKIVVASYMGWRKVLTADYNKFNLVVKDDYRQMNQEEYVYNHNGKLLFFFDYNPADVPVYNPTVKRIDDEYWIEKLHASKQPYGIDWEMGNHINYTMNGADCNGVPTFSHWTEDKITNDDTWNYYGHEQFAPLTVKTVVMWFGWFLFQLNNSYLKIYYQK